MTSARERAEEMASAPEIMFAGDNFTERVEARTEFTHQLEASITAAVAENDALWRQALHAVHDIPMFRNDGAAVAIAFQAFLAEVERRKTSP